MRTPSPSQSHTYEPARVGTPVPSLYNWGVLPLQFIVNPSTDAYFDSSSSCLLRNLTTSLFCLFDLSLSTGFEYPQVFPIYQLQQSKTKKCQTWLLSWSIFTLLPSREWVYVCHPPYPALNLRGCDSLVAHGVRWIWCCMTPKAKLGKTAQLLPCSLINAHLWSPKLPCK